MQINNFFILQLAINNWLVYAYIEMSQVTDARVLNKFSVLCFFYFIFFVFVPCPMLPLSVLFDFFFDFLFIAPSFLSNVT